MKNLKLFVFALCAVLLSVVTVNAATPNAQIGNLECYDDIGQCLNYAFTNGGTLNINADIPNINVARHTINGNLVIDAHGHKLTFAGVTYSAENGMSLTIKNATVVATNPSFVLFATDNKSSLTLDNVVVEKSWVVLENMGTATVNGGVVKSETSGEVFRNHGSLTLNNVEVTATTGALVNVEKHATTTTVNNGTYNVKTLLVSPSKTPAGADLGEGIAAEVAAKVVLNGGTYTTTNQAMELRNGIAVIVDGGTVKAKTENVVSVHDASLTVNGGTLMAVIGDAVYMVEDYAGKLVVNGGIIQTNDAGHYALRLASTKASYAISGGTFESKGAEDQAAILLVNMATKVENETITLNKAVVGTLTGGRYLNKIVAKAQLGNLTADVTNQLVAEGYTVKDDKDYKVVVSTKASTDTTKPGAPGKEEAPNTFDAGLVYMGLALSAIGASVVSVRKLRNN